jgi:uncharacterized oxidoreductase
MPTVRPDALRQACTRAFVALGVPAAAAALVADHLVDAELAGVISHGILRVPQYVELIRHGKIVPDARLSVLKETPATAVLDGGHGFGQVMAHEAMEHALRLAARAGVGAVTLVNCSHTGRLGSYTEHAARQGFIGLMMVNSGGHGQWVAPFGGLAGRLATNPLSVAVPTGLEFPLVLDIATSAAPEGRIRALCALGQAIPPGWVIRPTGEPTTNPADLYGPPRGALLPFGGHKGYGLALVVEALAGGLSGAGCCADPEAPLAGVTDGVFLLALQVEAFCPSAVFQEQMAGLVRHLKSCPPAPGFAGVLVPGEREARERERRLREGVPIGEAIWETLQRSLQALAVPLEAEASR